jgi:hypothetical protein
MRGVWSSMRYELRQMEQQGSGAIVNNASVGEALRRKYEVRQDGLPQS